ncbi:unnamed protein product [Commensalibacter communis]|nr:unnamed protein product [Commensalibacter communis]CAI3961677.1 unnamed protein product [Commensalibacter communis]
MGRLEVCLIYLPEHNNKSHKKSLQSITRKFDQFLEVFHRLNRLKGEL